MTVPLSVTGRLLKYNGVDVDAEMHTWASLFLMLVEILTWYTGPYCPVPGTHRTPFHRKTQR